VADGQPVDLFDEDLPYTPEGGAEEPPYAQVKDAVLAGDRGVEHPPLVPAMHPPRQGRAHASIAI
jgi:hypothetical protein